MSGPTRRVHVRQFADAYGGRAPSCPESLKNKPGGDGVFGNPHVVEPYACRLCKTTHKRGEAVDLFADYFFERVHNDEKFRSEVRKCKGKRIACHCQPDARCHVDVIVDYLESPHA